MPTLHFWRISSQQGPLRIIEICLSCIFRVYCVDKPTSKQRKAAFMQKPMAQTDRHWLNMHMCSNTQFAFVSFFVPVVTSLLSFIYKCFLKIKTLNWMKFCLLASGFISIIPHPVASEHRWLVKAPRWIHSVPDVSGRRSWRRGCHAQLWNLHDVTNTSRL